MDKQRKKASANETRKSSSRSRERSCENLSFAAKEAFKRLRTNLVMSFPEGDDQCRLIGVTSAQPSDGKSTIAINLAYSLAELEKKVLLIDADMRRPTIHTRANVEKAPGLSNLMSDSNSIAGAIKKYTSSVNETAFDIIPGGDTPQNPSELLNSTRMSNLLRTLATAYDYIVLDLPPVGAVIDAVAVSKKIDGMIVVIRENTCPKSLLADCMSQLEFAKVKVLGFVVNGALEGSGKKYQYNNYNYYY